MKYEKIYQELRKEYTDEEIVDSMFIPADLTEQEEKRLAEEMKQIRLQKLQETTEEDRIVANVMNLRFEIEDYTNKKLFSWEQTFGKYVEKYVLAVKRTVKTLAEDLSMEEAVLVEIIAEKREPSMELIFRLEKHSGNFIKTELWWKLILKKQLFILSKDVEIQRVEQQKVRSVLKA